MDHIICPLEQLEKLCGLPKRRVNYSGEMTPSSDACLGRQCTVEGQQMTVVSICFEYLPGKVRAKLQ